MPLRKFKTKFPAARIWSLLIVVLFMSLNMGCRFNRIGPHYFDKKCHRDLPRIWKGVSCPQREEAPENTVSGEGTDGGTPPCSLAINPSQCMQDGIQHSVWRSELKQAGIIFNYKLSYQSYYEFQTDGSYAHYLIFTHPFLSKRYFEKRQGMINLQKKTPLIPYSGPYTLDFSLTSSSCDGHAKPSLFSVFDNSNKSHVIRSGQQLSFKFPDLDFEVEIRSFEDLKNAWILIFLEPVFEIFLAPLTPNFWKEIVTGPHSWDERTSAELTSTLASAEELCFSEDGFQSLVPKLNIPPEVLILLSQ